MTFLQLVNQVLIKLRETQASATTDSEYITMVAGFVNEAMEETQKSWDWTGLRTIVPITTASGTSEYAVTGTNDASTIRMVYNDTTNNFIYKQSYDYIQQMYATSAVTPSGSPSYFAPIGFDTSNQIKLKFYGEPDAIETINVYCTIPQAAFDLDGTDDASTISTPTRPIILGAYARAVEERGEDAGTSSNSAYSQYQRAWGDAIAIDASLTTGETEWQVD